MSEWLYNTQRWLMAAAVVLTGCLFAPQLADPVNVIKLTVLVVSALSIGLTSGLRAARDRVLALPRSLAAIAGVLVAVAFLVSALIAPNRTTAIVGTYGRNSGLMAYAAALLLFFVGLRVWTAASAPILALALAVSGVFTTSYGLLQYAGVDAIHWNNPFNPIIASMGNPDFASAYLGICTPALALGALWRGLPLPWRLISGFAAGMCLLTAVLSKAVQGPLAAAAGLGVLAAAVLLERGGQAARRGLLGLGSAVIILVAALAAGAAKIGPAAPIFRRYSFEARQFYWDGALSMFRQHPLLGVGLDHYGAHWRQVRPDAATQFLGPTSFTDAAHSVPLQMLAQGGLLLGVAYLAFVVSVAIALVRGLRRLTGPPRLLMGAIGGAWTAYVVSAAVSIDQVPLVTVEFVTAGAVVALTGTSVRELRLAGAPVPIVEDRSRRRRTAPALRQRSMSGADLAIVSGLGVVVLVLNWFALLPLRASAAARAGDAALAAGDGNSALNAFQRANRLLPGEGAYWGRAASLYETVGRPESALATYRRAVHHAPLDVALQLNLARVAQAQHQEEVAATAFRAALVLDPFNPATVQVAAAFEAGNGEPRQAADALARAARANPSNADLLASLGAALQRAGDVASARRAYTQALTVQPNLASAAAGLRSLDARAS